MRRHCLRCASQQSYACCASLLRQCLWYLFSKHVTCAACQHEWGILRRVRPAHIWLESGFTGYCGGRGRGGDAPAIAWPITKGTRWQSEDRPAYLGNISVVLSTGTAALGISFSDEIRRCVAVPALLMSMAYVQTRFMTCSWYFQFTYCRYTKQLRARSRSWRSFRPESCNRSFIEDCHINF